MAEDFGTQIVNEPIGLIQNALAQFGQDILFKFPVILGGLALLLIGWVIADLSRKLVIALVDRTRLDEWLEEQNLSSAIGGHTLAVVLGTIVKWSIIGLVLAQISDAFLKFKIFADVLGYLATKLIWGLLVAVIIGVVGLLIARYVRNIIEATPGRFRHIFAVGLEVVIIYLALIMALGVIQDPLGNPIIRTEILEHTFIIGFSGFMLAFAIAAGLAFGLAFKEDAKKLLREFQHDEGEEEDEEKPRRKKHTH